MSAIIRSVWGLSCVMDGCHGFVVRSGWLPWFRENASEIMKIEDFVTNFLET